MQCPYCKTENIDTEIHCTFCEADLHAKRPTIKPYIDVTDVLKSFKEILTYHTYDLFKMLQIARKGRSEAFNLLRITLKASNDMEVPQDLKNDTENEYRIFTARMHLIEEILIDRIGYKPERVDDKLLSAWAKRIGLKELP